MPVTGTKNPITHLPVASAPSPVTVSVPAGNAARTLAAPAAGPRALVIGQSSVQVDLTKHTPMNIVDLINNGGIAGVTATLDRYGQLVINGVNSVTGDALLLQHLGFA